MKIIKKVKVPIICGINVDENNDVSFNWNNDDLDDVIHLCKDSSGEYNSDSVRYVYGYVYNESADFNEWRVVRTYLKNIGLFTGVLDDDVMEFVESGIGRLDSYQRISTYSAIVRTESSQDYSLVDAMEGYIIDEMSDLSSFVDIQLVKAACADVEFNKDLAYRALKERTSLSESDINRSIKRAEKALDRCKANNELFQMKKFMPVALRDGFLNFLKFRNDDEKQLYFNLQGVDVLLFDDFLTSRSTIKEMIRCLRSIHDENRLTAFALVKQH